MLYCPPEYPSSFAAIPLNGQQRYYDSYFFTAATAMAYGLFLPDTQLYSPNFRYVPLAK